MEILLYKFLKKKNSEFSYQYLIKIFTFFGKRSLNLISKIISNKKFFFKDLKKKSILKNFLESEIIASLILNGFFIKKKVLDKKKINNILNFLKNIKGKYQSSKYSSNFPEILNLKNIKGPRFQYQESDLINSKEIQNLILDKNLLEIAQEYLDSAPIIDYFACYWSFKGSEDSQAAQCWHFDLDRPRWIKIFFYLTDCKFENGPHVYIKKSHINIPFKIRKQGYVRISKSTIKNTYPKKNIIYFTANKGDMLIEDTSGLHKGLALKKGKRLMLMIQYSSSLFGSKSNKINLPKNFSKNFFNLRKKYPKLFENFKTSKAYL